MCQIYKDANNDIKHVWLIFPAKVGIFLLICVGYIAENNIDCNAVPIIREEHLAYPWIIKKKHKCSVEHKTHSQQLVYGALSRVTNMEGIFIVSKDKSNTFFMAVKKPHLVLICNSSLKDFLLNWKPFLKSCLILFWKEEDYHFIQAIAKVYGPM